MAKRAAVCPKCGAAVTPNVQFCAGCGLNLFEAEAQRHAVNEARAKESTARQTQLIFIVFIAIMIVGWYLTRH